MLTVSYLFCLFVLYGKVRCAALGLLPGAMLGASSWGEQQRCLPLLLLPPPHCGCGVSWVRAERR